MAKIETLQLIQGLLPAIALLCYTYGLAKGFHQPVII